MPCFSQNCAILTSTRSPSKSWSTWSLSSTRIGISKSNFGFAAWSTPCLLPAAAAAASSSSSFLSKAVVSMIAWRIVWPKSSSLTPFSLQNLATSVSSMSPSWTRRRMSLPSMLNGIENRNVFSSSAAACPLPLCASETLAAKASIRTLPFCSKSKLCAVQKRSTAARTVSPSNARSINFMLSTMISRVTRGTGGSAGTFESQPSSIHCARASFGSVPQSLRGTTLCCICSSVHVSIFLLSS
mmetsp:Transcript_12436/g.18667  ORF Transcript_12436/g.18667 Transcript_12436/m.18667 type:complete len:242 (+) Transcript_12436:18-743(+)